ncbi:oligosaccharide flippase family protein [Chloroflexota bacterium]
MSRDSFIMVVASLLSAVCAYFYQLFMAMFLTPQEYGILLSLTSLMVIVSMFGDTITLIVARLTSKFKAEARVAVVNYIWHLSLKGTSAIGVLMFALAAVLSPLLCKSLNIDNHLYPVILFSSFIFGFSLSGNWGVMQGLQRFLSLGSNRILWALLRPTFAVLFVYLGFGITGGLAAIPLSYAIAFIATFPFLGNLSSAGNEKVKIEQIGSYMSLTLLALFSITMLSNIDVVLAKHYLTPIDAGNYSAVSILGRICFYAPIGVAIAMFPKTSASFESHGKHHQLFIKAVLLTTLIVGTIGLTYALFSETIVRLLFSDKYSMVTPYIFKYGLGMSFLSLSYLTMTYLLSIGKRKVAYSLLAATLSQFGLIILFHTDISQLVDIMFISGLISLVLVSPCLLKGR